MSDGVHHSAVVGGSNCGRIMACPPSRLSGVPVPDTGTAYTERGTVLHKAMEDFLTTGAIPDVVQTTPIIGEMREAADEAVRLWELVASDVTLKHVHVELKLHMAPVPGAFGTTDVLIEHTDNKVTLLDWKFGVQKTSWSQLIFYAACAMTDKQTRHLFDGNTRIRLLIIQPSAMSGETFRSHEVDVADVFDFIAKLKWAVDNGHRDELLNAGDHCRWCPVKVVCPEIARLADKALSYKDPYGLTDAQASDALALADQLENWITTVRKYAHERLNGGGKIPGYKLVAKRAVRRWVSDEDVTGWASRVGMGKDIWDAPKLKTPAAVEKLVKKRELELPKSLYQHVSSGTTIASEKDPRPEAASLGQLTDVAAKLSAMTRR